MGRRVPPPVHVEPPADPRELGPEDLLRDGALTVAAACAFSGVGETEMKRALAAGSIPSFKRGRIRLIPRRGLVLYLARLHLDHNRT